MKYIELLQKTATKYESLVCLGLDPVLEKIPLEKGSAAERIKIFYEEILNEIVKQKSYPSAAKPNYAFYAQYGIEGLTALEYIISIYQEAGIPVILDAKRGDIGNTSKAYAKECFEFFHADAVTLAPYMGSDSITPFTKNYPDKGYYILNKTSNKSSAEIENLKLKNDQPLYLAVSQKICEDWYQEGISAVTGATYPEELSQITEIFSAHKKLIPLLIPGIGTQGGDLDAVMNILTKTDDLKIHRINSSSGLNYAYLNYPGLNYQQATVEALKKLNDKINKYYQS